MLDVLRQPEYTGSNRCLACTVVNCCLAAIIAIFFTLFSPVLGGVSLVFSLGTIYLRGYLVPGTPALTKRYFPPWLLRWFGRRQTGPAALTNSHEELQTADNRPSSELEQVDFLAECPEKDDICLDPDFQRAWRRVIGEIRQDKSRQRELLANMLYADFEPSEVSLKEGGTRFTATVKQEDIGEWRSRAPFLADVAAAAVLNEWDDEWDEQSIQTRGNKLARLRVFLESCPACDAPVTLQSDEGGACCWSREVTTVRCTECEAPLVRIDELAFDDGNRTYV
jgi:hypothetical protein